MSDNPDRDRDAGQSNQLRASVEGRGNPAEALEETARTPAPTPRTTTPEASGLARIGALGEPSDPQLDEGTQAGEGTAPTQGRADELTRIDRRLDALERDLDLVRNLAMQMRDGERAWIDDRLRRTGRDLGIGLMVMVLLAAILFAANWWRTDRRFDSIAARLAGLDQRSAAASAALPPPAAQLQTATQGGNATLAESPSVKVAAIAKGQEQLAGRPDRRQVVTDAADKPATAEPPPADPAPTTSDSQPPAAPLEGERYAIQLIGFRTVASIGPFAHRLGIAGKARYTATKHKGGDWYVVLLGDYASREEAQDAAAALPQEMRDLNPWVRPLRAGSQLFPID